MALWNLAFQVEKHFQRQNTIYDLGQLQTAVIGKASLIFQGIVKEEDCRYGKEYFREAGNYDTIRKNDE